jgi:hypothetical protein
MSQGEFTPERRQHMDQRMERMSKMMHCMSGFESRPAMKEPEMQQQMNQMRRQMDEMMRDPSMKSPAAFQKFQQAQGELSGALSRLLVVSENYPNLRANQGQDKSVSTRSAGCQGGRCSVWRARGARLRTRLQLFCIELG